MSKLSSGQLNILRLIIEGADEDGWAKVSNIIWPMVAGLPADLVELRPSDNGGSVRLTEHGHVVVKYS